MTREEAITNYIVPAIKRTWNDKKCKEILEVLEEEPKTGHWIRMKAYEKWGCSECNTVFRFTFKEHDYCPNCGAKMVESQESEDKR